MNILFYTEHLSLRGTEVALYDYAHYNETLLGNKSYILINGNQPEHKNPARNKFLSRFNNIYNVKNIKEHEYLIKNLNIDFQYKICAGHPEPLPSNCKNGIHVVFPALSPFGDKYVYVSKWLRDACTQGNSIHYEYVPHIVELPNINDDMRNELEIPKDKLVFGYHGGSDSFDIDFVKQTIINICKETKDIYFVFMNIPSFFTSKNIKYIPGTWDTFIKTKFINTCDAMIHARRRGETFGLSVAEFSIRNKKIITYGGSPEKNHIDTLGEHAIIYNDESELKSLIYNFKRTSENVDCYSKEFNHKSVMEKFKNIFLKG